MGDNDIQEELMENPDIEIGGSSLLANDAPKQMKKTDIRRLL